jgi:hypothetical protein
LPEVNITIPVPQGTKSRFVVFDIKKNHLKVGLKGQPPIIDVSNYNNKKFHLVLWDDNVSGEPDVLLQQYILWALTSCCYFLYYQGELYKPVKVDDCFWSIGKSLAFSLLRWLQLQLLSRDDIGACFSSVLSPLLTEVWLPNDNIL